MEFLVLNLRANFTFGAAHEVHDVGKNLLICVNADLFERVHTVKLVAMCYELFGG
jgi:hypothetical protein